MKNNKGGLLCNVCGLPTENFINVHDTTLDCIASLKEKLSDKESNISSAQKKINDNNKLLNLIFGLLKLWIHSDKYKINSIEKIYNNVNIELPRCRKNL